MQYRRSNTLEIATPDGVVFSLPLAGPVIRSLALMIDLAVISVMINIIYAALLPLMGFFPDITTGLFILIQFSVQIFYTILLEALWGGKTIGKKVLGLRVADERGLRLTYHQVIVRNLLRIVDALPFFYLLGGLTAFINRHNQRLGDLVAGTVVIRTVLPFSNPIQRQTDKYNSFHQYPALEARLRQRTSPDEIMVLVQALARRDSLSSDARVELFAEIATHFRGKVHFPDVAVHGLTDEQYLRNTADSLFFKPVSLR